jgi:hypothetical protein
VAADASGNAFDGVIGGTVNWVEGTLGGALEFMGSDSVVLPADLIEMTSDIGSVAFWMNCDVPTSIYTIFWAGDNTTGGGFGPENEMTVHIEQSGSSWTGGECSFFMIANPNTFLFTDPDKGTDPAAAPVNPTLLDDKEWHHVAATWGNGSVKLYIDGALIMESAYTSSSYQLSHIYLAQMANHSRTYIGKLDDFRLYKGVLFDFEITDLYNKVTNVSESKVKAQEFSVYPSPASDYLNVNFVSKAGNLAEISLVNVVGQKVATKSVTTIAGVNKFTVNLNDVAQGIYFIQLELNNEVTVKKVLVR